MNDFLKSVYMSNVKTSTANALGEWAGELRFFAHRRILLLTVRVCDLIKTKDSIIYVCHKQSSLKFFEFQELRRFLGLILAEHSSFY